MLRNSWPECPASFHAPRQVNGLLGRPALKWGGEGGVKEDPSCSDGGEGGVVGLEVMVGKGLVMVGWLVV